MMIIKAITFFFAFNLCAGITKFNVYNSKKYTHSIHEACQSLGKEHARLVDVVNLSTLDCMGKKLSIRDFCYSRYRMENFMRGLFDKRSGEVVCQLGDRLMLSYQCDKAKDAYCLDAKQTCRIFGKKFAYRLQLAKSFRSETLAGPPALSCLYEARKMRVFAHKNVDLLSDSRESDYYISNPIY